MVSSLELWCGCTVAVVRDPPTGLTVSRIVTRKSPHCDDTAHHNARRAWLIDLLPSRHFGRGSSCDAESGFASKDFSDQTVFGTEKDSDTVHEGAFDCETSVRI